MKVLYLFAEKPDALAKKLMEAQTPDHEITTINLRDGTVSYEQVVDEIFAADKVISWNGG